MRESSEPISWTELNKWLMATHDENKVKKFLDRGWNNPRWTRRIYSRYNFLRTRRERKALGGGRQRNKTVTAE